VATASPWRKRSSRVFCPFLGSPAGSGPFDLRPVESNEDLEEQREAYLVAVPNANEDQLESGLYTLDEMARVLGGSPVDDQARAVLALSFFDQGVILSGGVGPDTRRVTDRMSGISPDLIRNLASIGEQQIRRAGLYDPSAADARRVVRDMKGASLAAAELLAEQKGEAAAFAYMEALERAAQDVNTKKATKAELANVARLLQLERPDRFRSWSAVPKSELKDLIEDQLDTLINPVPPPEVARVARGALRRRRDSQRSRPGGTAVGLARARDLANRRNVSRDTLERMVSFFQRHDGHQERKARRDPTSPAAVAWDLWGGDPGREWATESLDRLGPS
jgi:hypothetical protein